MRRVIFLAGIVAVISQRGAAQGIAPFFASDPGANDQIVKIIGSVEQKGLPTDPILTKVRQGLTLHAQPTVIVAAAQKLASRLEIARDALAPHPTMLDIVAGQDALLFGASPAELRAVRAASANQSLLVPLGVLSQLVVSGVNAKRAAEIVVNLMRRGVSPDQLATLGNDVDSDVHHGAQALSALDIRTRGLNAVLAPPGAAAAADASGFTSGSIPKKP